MGLAHFVRIMHALPPPFSYSPASCNVCLDNQLPRINCSLMLYQYGLSKRYVQVSVPCSAEPVERSHFPVILVTSRFLRHFVDLPLLSYSWATLLEYFANWISSDPSGAEISVCFQLVSMAGVVNGGWLEAERLPYHGEPRPRDVLHCSSQYWIDEKTIRRNFIKARFHSPSATLASPADFT
jgi:hypothetical protein